MNSLSVYTSETVMAAELRFCLRAKQGPAVAFKATKAPGIREPTRQSAFLNPVVRVVRGGQRQTSAQPADDSSLLRASARLKTKLFRFLCKLYACRNLILIKAPH